MRQRSDSNRRSPRAHLPKSLRLEWKRFSKSSKDGTFSCFFADLIIVLPYFLIWSCPWFYPQTSSFRLGLLDFLILMRAAPILPVNCFQNPRLGRNFAKIRSLGRIWPSILMVGEFWYIAMRCRIVYCAKDLILFMSLIVYWTRKLGGIFYTCECNIVKNPNFRGKFWLEICQNLAFYKDLVEDLIAFVYEVTLY